MGKLELDHKFDPEKCRHFLEEKPSVLHCHHYITLYTQLAEDAEEMFGGIKLIKETSKDVFCEVLKKYYEKKGTTDNQEKAKIAGDYWFTCGMGTLVITKCEEAGGEAEMTHSHIDEGWIKKWGKRDKPVNFVTQGYLAGVFASIFGKGYNVEEVDAIVKGDAKSTFKITQA